jgi:acyl-CoA thioesterase-2
MTELLSLSNRLAMSAVCAIEQIDENLFRSTAVYRADDGPRHGGRGNPIYGGQVAAQALLAAGSTAADRLPHSLHAYFLRPGRTDQPIDLQVEVERDGRSYSSRRVVAVQDGQRNLFDVRVLPAAQRRFRRGGRCRAVAPGCAGTRGLRTGRGRTRDRHGSSDVHQTDSGTILSDAVLGATA